MGEKTGLAVGGHGKGIQCPCLLHIKHGVTSKQVNPPQGTLKGTQNLDNGKNCSILSRPNGHTLFGRLCPVLGTNVQKSRVTKIVNEPGAKSFEGMCSLLKGAI